MSFPEGAPETHSPEEPTREDKKSPQSKLGKIARAALFSAGLLAGVDSSVQAEEPPLFSPGTIEAPALGLESSQRLESENDWMELAQSEPVSALRRLSEIKDRSYAPRILETIADHDPLIAYLDYEYYKNTPNAKEILEQCVRKVLDQGREGAEYVLGDPSPIRDLKDFQLFYREAAEKSSDLSVLHHTGALFEYLPRSFAESIVGLACNRMVKENPYVIVMDAEDIRTFVPGGSQLVHEAIEESIKREPSQVFLYMGTFMNALSEEERPSFVEKLLQSDPVGAYLYLESPDEGIETDKFDAIVKASGSPEAVILRQILDLAVTAPTKEKLPLILDEFVFNKRFTLEEGVKIVEDQNQLLKLLGEITKRKNYIGRQSISDFLSSPIKNKLIESM